MSRTTIILDDLEFAWKEDDIKQAEAMWKAGSKFVDIVDAVRPPGLRPGGGGRPVPYDTRADETALLLIHLAREGRIKRRRGGVLGC